MYFIARIIANILSIFLQKNLISVTIMPMIIIEKTDYALFEL